MTVLRGNAGEVATLVGVEAEVRGVESIGAGGDPAELARDGRHARSALVASVTGPVDHVSDGERSSRVANGDPDARDDHRHRLHVVSASPAASSPSTATRRSRRPPRRSSRSASPARTRRAARKGPGSFHVALYDALAALDPATLDGRARDRREGARDRRGSRDGAACGRGRRDRRPAAREGADRRGRRARARASASSARRSSSTTTSRRRSSSARTASTSGRATPARHERARPPGCCSAARRRRSSRRSTPTPTTSASGPIWETPSKADADPADRPRGAARICAAVRVPVVAIGGIDASNAAECIRAGRRRRGRRSARRRDPTLQEGGR